MDLTMCYTNEAREPHIWHGKITHRSVGEIKSGGKLYLQQLGVEGEMESVKARGRKAKGENKDLAKQPATAEEMPIKK
jgi:hypothetical protein